MPFEMSTSLLQQRRKVAANESSSWDTVEVQPATTISSNNYHDDDDDDDDDNHSKAHVASSSSPSSYFWSSCRRRRGGHSIQLRKHRGTRNTAHPKILFWRFMLVVSIFVMGYFSSLFHNHHSNKYNNYNNNLPVPNVDIPVPSPHEWPIIHIVHTRRFHLFRTFCFPTMIGQTSQDFLWIIKTDPKLNDHLLQTLVTLVQPYPNICLVASNQNFLISPEIKGCWKDGAEAKSLLESHFYTGNQTRLWQAMALREERPVLETRLDANDGLC